MCSYIFISIVALRIVRVYFIIMWSLKFVVLILGGIFFVFYSLSLYMLASFFKCEQKTYATDPVTSQITALPFRSGLLEQLSTANSRPPLVRFRWYAKNGGPIHIG